MRVSKVLIFFISCLFFTTACSNEQEFIIDSDKLNLNSSNKNVDIISSFDDRYKLNYVSSGVDSSLEKEIIELSKKTTYLLLGDFNNQNETQEEFYNRKMEFYNLRFAPDIPLDESTYSGFDEDSQEFKDDLISGLAIPSLFLQYEKLNVRYNSYGDINVIQSRDYVIATVSLPNVIIKQEDPDNRSEYKDYKEDVILYYYFKELNGEYKLYNLFGSSGSDLDNYFVNEEGFEKAGTVSIAAVHNSEISSLYDFSKVDAVTDEQVNNIYNSNKSNILILNSYYNNININSAGGFFIDNGLVVTSWTFLNEALSEAQYITIKSSDGVIYQLDGVVTVNIDSDIAVLKLKEEPLNQITIGNLDNVDIEDPLVMISSRTNVGTTIQKGLLISKEGDIELSIPITDSDIGNPLFDINGNVVGIVSGKKINAETSLATSYLGLNEIIDKFKDVVFEDINFVSFDKLKEDYYYKKSNEEVKDVDIDGNKWDEFLEQGDLENSINLDLIKANYINNSISLRYVNNSSDLINNINLASVYISNLKNEGYKEELNSSTKKIYSNGEYQVIITDEFDYLIIVMVKL